MEHLDTFEEFVERLNKQLAIEKEKERFQVLAGIKKSDNIKYQYAIQLTFDKLTIDNKLLLEHELYSKFQKSTNRLLKHPEKPEIPVKGHYHIVPSNSEKELYAVNMDGTAHHKKNRGHIVPKKEAEELRLLGVKIPKNNIIESKQWFINESNVNNYLTIFIIISEE